MKIRNTWMPALFIAGILFACKNDLEQVRAIDLDISGPERVTYNAVYFYSDSGIVRNRLKAAKVELFRGDSSITKISDGLEMTIFGSGGKNNSILTANNGIIRQNEGRMEVYNDVQFINAKGEKLNTERLIWEQDSDRVYTDNFVRITRAQDTIYGNGMVAAQDMSWYKLTGVSGDFQINDGE